jgi:hypothetical protein
VTKRPEKPSATKPTPPGAVHRGHPAPAQGRSRDEPAAGFDTGRFLREAQANQGQEGDSAGWSASRPTVTQLPEGYIVVEQRVGRATAQWLLHIRCECGYAWFDSDAKEDKRCPECGRQVYLDIQPAGR